MNPFKKMIVFAILVSSASAFALDLKTARATKKVTELPTGYIQANDPSAKELEKEINEKRKQTYEEIAKKNGLTVDQVAAQAAKKIAGER